ncbi:hypothetical protein ACFS5N_11485 [Mucilaginibacter ximonensis]|uniref:Prepilin-type N-terminal cleavage/methylation domain-containing protein n=1 Tax=Mucilaginibacter ximonensis TaxID=538021 RepID=A0ABW5YDQ2_9SPHI
MLLTTLEILLLLGAILLPLVPRKANSKLNRKPKQAARAELSDYVVTETGQLEEIVRPHNSPLSQ